MYVQTRALKAPREGPRPRTPTSTCVRISDIRTSRCDVRCVFVSTPAPISHSLCRSAFLSFCLSPLRARPFSAQLRFNPYSTHTSYTGLTGVTNNARSPRQTSHSSQWTQTPDLFVKDVLNAPPQNTPERPGQTPPPAANCAGTVRAARRAPVRLSE